MARTLTLEIPIAGMDCVECTQHVRQALVNLPGVESAEVFLASEKAILRLDPAQVNLAVIRQVVEGAGYSVAQKAQQEVTAVTRQGWPAFSHRVNRLIPIGFGLVIVIVVVGEWLGVFENLNHLISWPFWVAAVLVIGYPIFGNVVRAAWRRQVTSHTLMTLGVLAALVVGEWMTAVVVVLLMRAGDAIENFTAGRTRRAVRDLTALAPQTARVERDGQEMVIPVGQVQVGEMVIVRPGDKLPVDGVVHDGYATINQAAITGEAMPVEVGPGDKVFAATLASLGSLRVRATQVGADTTFGRIVKLVEEAEAHRADVQRFADRFTRYYLPVVVTVAALTLLIGRDPLAMAAVLVVACSCSIALATPIAMLASIGAAAKQGLLIKGGKYLELLAQADVLLIDKTGTVTLGQPMVTDVIALNGQNEDELLALVAAVEQYSEHPVAAAVRGAARHRHLKIVESRHFQAIPGLGVRAAVNGKTITVGNRRLIEKDEGGRMKDERLNGQLSFIVDKLESEGKTLLLVAEDDTLTGLVAVSDTLRSEAPAALSRLRQLGIRRIELLTGDHDRSAAALSAALGIDYRANLLPEDKIAIVRDYQAQGHRVIMVGDGVNDAPALAQADVGMAMGAAGTDVALEAAHVALMREDWSLVPELIQIARRTMGVVKMNLGFTAVYNVVGISLAALGIMPPVLAAAAQSLPDLGILANSSRLLKQTVKSNE
ncbi:MAG: cation-translocating P-type ATPase [Chloroflexota bacterium]